MLSQIISELADPSIPLTAPLLKLKVVSSRIKNETLYSIVSKELAGYDPLEKLPNYRKARGNSLGNIQQDYSIFRNTPLPIISLPEELHEALLKFNLPNGIESLESIARDLERTTLMKPFGPEFSAMLTQKAQEAGLRMIIADAQIRTDRTEVIAVLGKIRDMFLELALKIESEFPDIDERIGKPLEPNNSVSKTVQQFIMTKINISNDGDGNIFNTGNENSFDVNIEIKKGDSEGLKKELERLEVPESEISEILDIVAEEVPSDDEKEFGPKTKSWIKRMLEKSMDGTWKIGLSTAGGVLARAISAYYGIG